MQQCFSTPLTDLRADSPLTSTNTKEQHHGRANRKSAVKDAAGLTTGNQDSMEDTFADKFSTYHANIVDREKKE